MHHLLINVDAMSNCIFVITLEEPSLAVKKFLWNLFTWLLDINPKFFKFFKKCRDLWVIFLMMVTDKLRNCFYKNILRVPWVHHSISLLKTFRVSFNFAVGKHWIILLMTTSFILGYAFPDVNTEHLCSLLWWARNTQTLL